MGGCRRVGRAQWALIFEYGYLKNVDRTFSQCHIHPKCWKARIPLKLCNHPDIGEFYSEGTYPPLPTQLWLNLSLFRTVSGASVIIMHSCSVTNLCQLLWPQELLWPWDFPRKNTGVGCHFFLQGIFLTQASDSNLLHWQAGSLALTEPPGKPLLL